MYKKKTQNMKKIHFTIGYNLASLFPKIQSFWVGQIRDFLCENKGILCSFISL